MLVDEVPDPEQDLGPLRERGRAPGRERRLGRGDGRVELLGRREVDPLRLRARWPGRTRARAGPTGPRPGGRRSSGRRTASEADVASLGSASWVMRVPPGRRSGGRCQAATLAPRARAGEGGDRPRAVPGRRSDAGPRGRIGPARTAGLVRVVGRVDRRRLIDRHVRTPGRGHHVERRAAPASRPRPTRASTCPMFSGPSTAGLRQVVATAARAIAHNAIPSRNTPPALRSKRPTVSRVSTHEDHEHRARTPRRPATDATGPRERATPTVPARGRPSPSRRPTAAPGRRRRASSRPCPRRARAAVARSGHASSDRPARRAVRRRSTPVIVPPTTASDSSKPPCVTSRKAAELAL